MTAASFRYLAWHFAVGAVFDVFMENRRREVRPGAIKASSDVWFTNEALRQQVHRRAATFWCRRAGKNATWFPLSVSAAARLYVRLWKRNEAELEEFARMLAAASGAAAPGTDGEDLFG